VEKGLEAAASSPDRERRPKARIPMFPNVTQERLRNEDREEEMTTVQEDSVQSRCKVMPRKRIAAGAATKKSKK